MSSRPPEPPIVVETLIRRVGISQMKPPGVEATKVLEAMKMEAAYVDWVAEKEAIHHNNYRALFEAGALEPLTQFLAKREIVQGTMGKLACRSHIPIEAMRDWRKTLLKDPGPRPYSQPANSSKRALVKEQEQKLGERLRTEYVSGGRYCPGRLVDIMARREWERQLKEGDERVTSLREMQPGMSRREDEEYQDIPMGKWRRFRASRTWRIRFLRSQHLRLRTPHAKR
jgi:hypothetical protein